MRECEVRPRARLRTNDLLVRSGRCATTMDESRAVALSARRFFRRTRQGVELLSGRMGAVVGSAIDVRVREPGPSSPGKDAERQVGLRRRGISRRLTCKNVPLPLKINVLA